MQNRHEEYLDQLKKKYADVINYARYNATKDRLVSRIKDLSEALVESCREGSYSDSSGKYEIEVVKNESTGGKTVKPYILKPYILLKGEDRTLEYESILHIVLRHATLVSIGGCDLHTFDRATKALINLYEYYDIIKDIFYNIGNQRLSKLEELREHIESLEQED